MKRLFPVVILVISLLSSCGFPALGRNVVSEYHGLIEAYQAAQKAAANGNTCLSLSFSQIVNQSQLANNYMEAEVARTDAYRKALSEFGSGQKAYLDKNGKALSPNQLDLAELVGAGATPADLALNINAYVTSFTEAPLPQMNPEPVLAAQQLVSEQYNQSFACVSDWNNAVERYNVERNKIPGDVVGRIAEYLKVKELPQQLPYFQMTAPQVPPAVPTISTK